jgi:hypothetical protein
MQNPPPDREPGAAGTGRTGTGGAGTSGTDETAGGATTTDATTTGSTTTGGSASAGGVAGTEASTPTSTRTTVTTEETGDSDRVVDRDRVVARDRVVDRPSGVTTAALILSMLGVLSLILGVLFFVAGNSAANLNPTGVDPATAARLGGGVTASGIFWLVFGALQLAAGILIWGGRQSGRLLGLLASVFGILIAAVTLLGTLAADAVPGLSGLVNPATQTTAIVAGIVLLLGYVLCLYALMRNSEWFRASRGERTA